MDLLRSNSGVILVLLSLLFVECNSYVKTDVLQSSFDISQSKINDVFVAEYVPSEKKLGFSNKTFYIQEVWVENYWVYKNLDKDIEVKKGQQGYIKLKNDNDIYELGFLFNNRKSGITGNKLCFEISKILDTFSLKFYFNKDTLPVQLYKK